MGIRGGDKGGQTVQIQSSKCCDPLNGSTQCSLFLLSKVRLPMQATEVHLAIQVEAYATFALQSFVRDSKIAFGKIRAPWTAATA